MYVITGATGNTGNIVARTLLGLDQKVRAIGRSAERLSSLVNEGAEAFVADVRNREELARAFTDARAVFVMIPPSSTSADYRQDQREISDALSGALADARVEHAVSLSSIGADKRAGTGPIAGLHELEEKLNQIEGLNVLHLRPTYFMENTLPQIGIIKMFGMAAGPLKADLKIPMIATRDIGAAAARALLSLDFNGHQTRELLGQRDLTMNEVASILGNAIGKTDLKYLAVPPEQVRMGLVQQGVSGNVADLILELGNALNTGHVVPLETRSDLNTNETSFETFAAEVFLPAYQQS